MKPKTILRITCLAVLCLLAGMALAAPALAQTATPTPFATYTPAPSPTPAPTSTPPYVDIGDTYYSMGDDAKASEYYLKAIEIDPGNAYAFDRLNRTIRRQNSVVRRGFARIGAALAPIADACAGVIFWGLVLLGLVLFARLVLVVNTYRAQAASAGKRVFVVHPLTNGTANDSLKGVEASVQAVLADYLATLGAYIQVTNAAEPAVEAQSLSLDDLDASPIKLLAWLLKAMRPEPVVTRVEGTLLAPTLLRTGQAPSKAIGFQVRFKRNGPRAASASHIFWSEVPESGAGPQDYTALAQQAAAWLYAYPQPAPTIAANALIYSGMRVRLAGGAASASVQEAQRLFRQAASLEDSSQSETAAVWSSAGGRTFSAERLSTLGSSLAQHLAGMLAGGPYTGEHE